MEQIQFIYFQDYMQYYSVHHKENSTYIWKFGIVGDGLSSSLNCQFVFVLLYIVDATDLMTDVDAHAEC